MRHKHADLIHAWAEGVEIELQTSPDVWIRVDPTHWVEHREYRIKPEVKPDVVWFTTIYRDGQIGNNWESFEVAKCQSTASPKAGYVKYVISAETGELLTAEVLK